MRNDKQRSETVTLLIPQKRIKRLDAIYDNAVIPVLIILIGGIINIISIIGLNVGMNKMLMASFMMLGLLMIQVGPQLYRDFIEKPLKNKNVYLHPVEFESARFGLESWNGRKEELKKLEKNPIFYDEIIEFEKSSKTIPDNPVNQGDALFVLDNFIHMNNYHLRRNHNEQR